VAAPSGLEALKGVESDNVEPVIEHFSRDGAPFHCASLSLLFVVNWDL
jgi:hypothetical protein